jgi:hypothetical protein
MLSKEKVTVLIDSIKKTHKATAANIHMYTNKIDSMHSMIDLHDMFASKGRDTTAIDTKIYRHMMDTFKWLDMQYNKSLYVER